MAKEKNTNIDEEAEDVTGTEQTIESDIISDDMLLGIYGEILNNIREDREAMTDVLGNFKEMVFNEGDASNASKEAIVKLLEDRNKANDSMSKIAEQMTRIKLKDRDTSRFITKQDGQVVNIGDTSSKTLRKNLIEEINKTKQQKKEEAKQKEEK